MSAGSRQDETFQKWAKESAPGFIFALKAAQDITHKYRLSMEAAERTQFMFDRARDGLGAKLGPILFQLPATFKKDAALLSSFCARLPAGCKAAFEFRHADWYCDEIYAILRQYNVSIVENVSLDNSVVSTDTVTADFTYLRFHKSLDTDNVNFPREFLEPYARRLVERRGQGLAQHLFFMNDVNGHGPKNACLLLEMANTIAGTSVAALWRPRATVKPGGRGSLDAFFAKKTKPAPAPAPAADAAEPEAKRHKAEPCEDAGDVPATEAGDASAAAEAGDGGAAAGDSGTAGGGAGATDPEVVVLD